MSTPSTTAVASTRPAANESTPPSNRPATAPKQPPKRAASAAVSAIYNAATEGYVALGYDGALNVIWSTQRRCVVYLDSQAVNGVVLETHAGKSWLMRNYFKTNDNGKGELNVAGARSDLIAACQAAGRYNAAQVMGAGVWAVEIDGARRLVCNSGQHLFSPDGKPVPRVSQYGVFAEGRDLGMRPGLEPASDEEVAELAASLGTWHWANPGDAALALGWLATAPFAGALWRRPILAIQGAGGSGKSTLDERFMWLLGQGRVSFTGSASTASGVTQRLQHDAVPVILDEFGDGYGKDKRDTIRVDALTLMLRSAYGDASDGVAKGTSDGRGVTYSSRFSGLISGIMMPQQEPQDRMRTVLCRLATLPKPAPRFPSILVNEARLTSLGARIRMRMLKSWPLVEESIDNIKLALIDDCIAPRIADTLSPLLAGWFVLTQRRAVSPASAPKLIKGIHLGPHIDRIENASAERDCADHLIGYRQQGSPYAIGELIRLVSEGKAEYERTLETLGIKLHNGFVQVCASKHLRDLREVFASSAFADGGWSVILERVPGAKITNPRFASKTTRAIAIPLAWFFDEPEAPVQERLF